MRCAWLLKNPTPERTPGGGVDYETVKKCGRGEYHKRSFMILLWNPLRRARNYRLFGAKTRSTINVPELHCQLAFWSRPAHR
jgi:hypothetical protein